MTDRESLLQARPRIVYKALQADGKSPMQGYKWPLPDGEDPGEWVEIDGTPKLCVRGLHGYLHEDSARVHGTRVYEMEVDGQIVEDGHKLAATRARLIRLLAKPPHEVVESGLQNCVTCGKPHDCLRTGRLSVSWADPDDGHAYHREPAEHMILRLLVERDALQVELKAARGE